MSCYWTIYCKTCDDSHEFAQSNHAREFMTLLITHASVIASINPLFEDKSDWREIELRSTCGYIDVGWFAVHHTHKLVPRDEYGREYC